MKNPTRCLIPAVLILILTLTLSPCAWAAGKISADLEQVLASADPAREIPVIITLNQKANLTQFAKLKRTLRRTRIIRALKQNADSSQAETVALLNQKKARKLRQLWLINGIAATTTPDVIRQLAGLKAVAQIRHDAVLTLSAPTTSTATVPASWNIGRVKADVLWNLGYLGQGVVVASMDSGVDYLHAELMGSYRGGSNSWYDPNGQHATPYDASGHGTQTMGILAAGAGIGMAPEASWIAVKIFNDQGQASLSVIHSGFQWLLDPDGNPASDDAPQVVNNSWGFEDRYDECYREFETDIATLKAADIAVVFAAGNSGPGDRTSISPANNPGSFAVGSVNSSDSISYSSSSGPSACQGDIFPEVSAPGVTILTTNLTYGGILPHATVYASGTSLAAPHAAGAMALLLSAHPNASVAELEAALMQSAIDLGASGPDNDYGYGRIDVAAAYDYLQGGPTCTDADGDGYFAQAGCGTAVDCNDADPSVHPGATDIPDDGIDQDCDGADATLCVDADGDGYFAQAGCGTAVDCDDTDPFVHPNAAEIPDDGIDQDCDGLDTTLCVDADGDGYFAAPDCGTAVDCNDADPSVHPNAAEIPDDGIDQDCDGQDGTLCVDADGDGFFASPDCGTLADCDDTAAGVHPGAAEIKRDGIDQDCNGYDLTINITKANYVSASDKIVVYATSLRGAAADLKADIPGIGLTALTWNSTQNRWQKTLTKAIKKGFNPADPGVVTVSGPEGQEMRAMLIK